MDHDSSNGKAAPEVTLTPAASSSSAVLQAPLICDICGVTGGRRGQAFRNLRDLKTHKAHAHRAVPLRTSNQNQSAPRVQHHAMTAAQVAHARFCPQCGCNLAVVNAALSFMGGQTAAPQASNQ